MRLFRYVLGHYLKLRFHFHESTRTGAFGPNGAEYIDMAVPVDGHALKKALFRHHVKQFHEASCSVASVVTVINALGTLQYPGFYPISQKDILKKVRAGHWRERMGPNGHNGRRGLPLPVLKEVVQASLEAYHIRHLSVTAVQAAKGTIQASKIKTELLDRLKSFETHAGGVIIAHFDQGAYVKAENIPHISPVGGFDLSDCKVTVLDVDRYQKSHYRIGMERFYQGLAHDYHHLFRLFGYSSGGYVWIALN